MGMGKQKKVISAKKCLEVQWEVKGCGKQTMVVRATLCIYDAKTFGCNELIMMH